MPPNRLSAADQAARMRSSPNTGRGEIDRTAGSARLTVPAPRLHIDNPTGLGLPPESEALLRALFPRHARLVVAAELAGGYSGCHVLQVMPFRAAGLAELPAVVKLGPAELIAAEARAYHDLIRGRLSGIPEIWGAPVSSPDGHWSGLRYAMVGSGLFQFESLRAYACHAPLVDLRHVMAERLFVHMSSLWEANIPTPGRSWAAAYDRVLPVNAVIDVKPLEPGVARTVIRPDALPARPMEIGQAVRVEGFVVVDLDVRTGEVTLDCPPDAGPASRRHRLRTAPLVELAGWEPGMPPPGEVVEGTVVDNRAAMLGRALAPALGEGVDLSAPELRLPGGVGRPLPNPLVALQELAGSQRSVNVATVHGDLNLENVLVDPEARTVHIVDFALSRDDDVLHDLLRLETGVLTLLLPGWLAAAGQPAEAVVGLLDDLHDPRPEPQGPGDLVRARLLLLLIRQRAAGLLFQRGQCAEYYDGLTAYLLGASRYGNLDPAGRRVAFWAAAAVRRLAAGPVLDADGAGCRAAIEALLGAGAVAHGRRRVAGAGLVLPSTTFVGRQADVATVGEWLRAGGCVTLLGPGGVGKTRTATEVAAAVADDFPDGVWFSYLTPARSALDLDQALASTLSVPEPVGETLRVAILRHLAPRTALLVLDNCEHVLAECRALVDHVRRQCPGVTVLATSREALQVPDEHVWPLQPLAVPAEDVDNSPELLMAVPAVQLFVDRVKRVRPGFTATAESLAAVAQVCRELDGLPLALELAAARARVLTVGQIAERLADQLRLFRQDGRLGTPHHQTLEATVDWSFALLDPGQQELLLRLAVFAGGFTLEAVAAVCPDASDATDADEGAAFDLLDRVVALAEKSLVVPPDDQARVPRYRLLGPIRAFALERLRAGAAWPKVAQRHAAWYLGWAERAAERLSGPDQAVWLDQLAAEHTNLSVALRYLVDRGDRARAGQLVSALGHFWLVRGRFAEGREWCRAVLAIAAAGEAPVALAGLHDVAGDLARQQGDFARARADYEQGLALKAAAGDERAVAETLRRLGNVADLQGRYDEAEGYMLASLARYEALSDAWGMAAVVNNLGLLAAHMGRIDLARERLVDCLARFRGLDEVWAVGVTQLNLGNVAYDQRRFDEARGYYAASLDIARELGDRMGIALGLTALGNLAGEDADYAGARRLFAEGLAELRPLNDRARIAELLESCAAIDRMDGRLAAAARLYAAAAGLREAIGFPLPTKEQAGRAAELAELRRDLGDEAFDREWARSRQMSWAQVAGEVLAGAQGT